MSEEVKQETEEIPFTFYPDKLARDPRTKQWHTQRGKRYVLLHSLGVGGSPNAKIVFTPDDCKYWMAEKREATPEFLEKFMPYLRWNFDKIEVRTNEKGEKYYTNENPPTPENIRAKKNELINEHISSGNLQFDLHKIEAQLCPWLADSEQTEQLKQRLYGNSYVDSHLKRLERTIRG